MANPIDQAGDSAAGSSRPVFSEKDKAGQPGRFVRRRFKDPAHFLSNLFELLTYTPDLARVYLAKSISPRLREMIMLTVASSNDCGA